MQRRLSKELGYKLPQPVWEGDPFELHRDGQFFGAAPVSALDLWAARIEHDDAVVPTRAWMVDLSLRRVADEVVFLIRMLCSTAYTVNELGTPSVPRIVRDLSDQIGLIDGRKVAAAPWMLKGAGDLDELELLVGSTDRRFPIVMLTERDPNKRGYGVSRFVLDERKLSKDLFGLAHVVVMPDDLTRE
jgi:hypothetical protein